MKEIASSKQCTNEQKNLVTLIQRNNANIFKLKETKGKQKEN